MAGVGVKAFNGLKPITEALLLEAGDAQVARNVLLNSGALKPMNALTTLMALKKFEPKTIYRFDPENDQPEDSYWLEFQEDTDVMRSPIAQDQWNRLYWTDGAEQPKYAPMSLVITPAADLSFPGHGYDLGVPKPANPPVIADFTKPEEVETTTRSYVLTYYNPTSSKESTPCKPTTVKAVDGEEVVFSSLPTSNKGDSGVTKKRLYRLIPDASPATTKTYRRLAEIDLLEPEYKDSLKDADGTGLPPLPAGSIDIPQAPQYGLMVTAEPIPDADSDTTPIRRDYIYTVGSFLYGGITYENSAASVMISVMADNSQTVTVSGMVNAGGAGTYFRLWRKNEDMNTYALVAQVPVSQTSIDDPLSVTKLGAALPPLNAPPVTSPATATISAASSTAGDKVKRIYMLTFIDVSNKESAKSPDSQIVEVIDGATTVSLSHSEPIPPGVTKKRLYRQDIAISSGVIVTSDANWRFVAENMASATAAVDKIATSALPGGGYPAGLQGLPPSPTNTGPVNAKIPPSVVPESRTYVYTYVTAYDEEGAPSKGSEVISCDPAKDVTLTLDAGPGGNYNLTKKRIYRSATGSARTKFQYVGECPIATTSFVDNVKTADLSELLETEGWIPPPKGLSGLRMMANGCAVGFVGNSLYFSEPNLPHAWPHEYPIDDEIIGIGTFGQSVAVLTRGYPYIFSGVDPGAMASQKVLLPEACTNKRSVVETGDGVLYASPDGLTMLGGNTSLVTSAILSRAQWQTFNPDSMEGYIYNGRVIIAYETKLDPKQRGILLLDMTGSGALFTTADINEAVPVTAGHYSPERDTLYFAQGGNIVRFDDGAPMLAVWKSKLYRLGQHDNFGFAQVTCKAYTPQPVLKVYADGILRMTKAITGPEEFRLPSGFKCLDWEFEIATQVEITETYLATSVAELQQA